MAKSPHIDPFGTQSPSVSGRWVIPDSLKQAALTRLAMFIADTKQRPRVVIAAIRAVAEISRLASQADQKSLQDEMDAMESMPMIVHTSKVEMDMMRAMTVEELMEFVGHPDARRFTTAPHGPRVSDEARARAERSLRMLNATAPDTDSEEPRPKAKILPVQRKSDA